MKKIVFLFISILTGMVSISQSSDDIKKLAFLPIDLPANAKETIDKFMSVEKNAKKPESWFWKGCIYNKMSKSETLKSSCDDCKMEAFEAFKKYQEMDPKNTQMAPDQNAFLFDIYSTYFDAGAQKYNTKDYDNAFTSFKKALVVKDYIYSKGFTLNSFKFTALDTSLILNTATSAVLAKKDSLAIPYYKMLTDANLDDKQYLEAYEYVVEYYKKHNDVSGFYAAIAKGRQIFPKEDYWVYIEMEYIGESATKKEAFAKYDELFNKYPDSYLVGYNFSVQLFNYLYANDEGAVIDTTYKSVFKNTIKRVINIKSTGEANLLMARALYNNYYELGDEAKKVKGTKPADLARRKAFTDAAGRELTDCIPYFEQTNAYFSSLPSLKAIEKANYKQSLGMLQDIYQLKNNQAKVAALDVKIKELQ